MQLLRIAIGVGLAVVSVATAQSEPKPTNPSTASVKDDDMGPAAFMWPPDRVWSGDMDNQAPCGSRSAAGNRTKFPLSKSFCNTDGRCRVYQYLLTCIPVSWWCGGSCSTR